MAGFSDDDNPIAYKVYIPELSGVVYSTNVVFDQNIPPPSEAYHGMDSGSLCPLVY
jgi:hypothetical protein